jgi:hypothetical protein
MLEAYMDESGRSDLNPRCFTVAGWLGNGLAWRKFELQWQAILRDSRFAILEFKSADFANRRGPYQDWPDDRRAELLSELLAVIQGVEIVGVAVVLTLAGC